MAAAMVIVNATDMTSSYLLLNKSETKSKYKLIKNYEWNIANKL